MGSGSSVQSGSILEGIATVNTICAGVSMFTYERVCVDQGERVRVDQREIRASGKMHTYMNTRQTNGRTTYRVPHLQNRAFA